MIALLPAIVFWFATAPQVRFGYGYIFGFAALAFSIGIADLPLPKCKRYAAALSILVLLLVMRIDRHILKIRPLAWPPIPTLLMDAHLTQDGIVIHTPRADDRGWNAPIPQTPNLRTDLRSVVDNQGRIRQWYIAPAR